MIGGYLQLGSTHSVAKHLMNRLYWERYEPETKQVSLHIELPFIPHISCGRNLYGCWKNLSEITNSNEDVVLGLPGAYCVRTSAQRNTVWRGEERNSFLRMSLNTGIQQCQNFWDSGPQSGVPRAAAAASLGTVWEMHILGHPDSLN